MKYHKCSKCGGEELFENEDTNHVCPICRSAIIQAMNNIKVNLGYGRYEDFLKPDEVNLYALIPCRKRLPGGHLCDAITGRAKKISVVVCMKCQIRITENTLQDCIKEDDDVIE